MTTNLRITRESINAKDPSNTTGKITSTDSNVSSNYTIPASSSSGWSTSDGNAEKVLYKDGDETNGAYYTWCAATAGSCSSATTANAIASASICPKGWRLPAKTDYDNFLSKAGIANSSAGSTKIQGAPYNFPYAGLVVDGSLQYIGSYGYYWSSTVYSSTYAYRLYFGSGGVDTYSNHRYDGLSVRCIAL